jgi:N-acetylglucosaminyldiphosphoundecaprenol N-acetyl-beta-D-mannosaminyltransferase
MKPMSSRISILGVPVDAVTQHQALKRVQEFMASGGKHQICTPNPEMVVEATKNPEFLSVLQASSLNIPDGAGMLWAAKYMGGFLPERVTGVDLLTAIATLSQPPSIFLLGAAPGVAEKAAAALRVLNPSLHIAGTFAGSPAKEIEGSIVDRINASKADVLFVAYGAPKQELWIHRNLPKLNITLAMGVGGAFDFLAGVRSRAPKWMQALHLEWLWRVVQEPSRLNRIVTATIRFPRLVKNASR